METGSLPIRFILANRRLAFYHTILSRSEEELTLRVFSAQKANPSKGYWDETVSDDFKLIGENINEFDESRIKSMNEAAYKKLIKKKIRTAALKSLEDKKAKQSKKENILYRNLSQKYLSKFTNDEVCLLAKLRSRNISVKVNFPGMHSDLLCSLGCGINENQQHILECQPILARSKIGSILTKVRHSDIYGPIKRQKIAVLVYADLLKTREECMQQQ